MKKLYLIIDLLKKTLKITNTLIRVTIELRNRRIPIYELSEAMAIMEGYYNPRNLAYRNRNPLNLRYSKYQSDNQNGFAIFETHKKGWVAGIWDLSQKCRGITSTGLTSQSTIAELISVWAPPSENNTENYIKFVVEKLKIHRDYKLGKFLL